MKTRLLVALAAFLINGVAQADPATDFRKLINRPKVPLAPVVEVPCIAMQSFRWELENNFWQARISSV